MGDGVRWLVAIALAVCVIGLIAYARGLEFLNVIFEQDDKDALLLEDRLIQVSVSLLTL